MPRHPTDGIKGSKPRVPGVQGNGKVTKAELGALNREYLKSRNRSQAAKAEAAEIALAEKKGTLIPRQMVLSQLGDLLVTFRQRCLLVPEAITRRLVSLNLISPEKRLTVVETIREDIHNLLTDLADLPEKVTDAADKLKAKQAKVKVRRQRKTETMRKLRAASRSRNTSGARVKS